MNSYQLSRQFVDWAFENPSKVSPYHYAIFFFAIEHCNRLGWKIEFGLPSHYVMEATGIKSYSAYKKYFDELVEFGFFVVKEYSKNQYTSNIIELSSKIKADSKALDKAITKHDSKQIESTAQSTCTINKLLNQEPYNNITPEGQNLGQNVTPSFVEQDREKAREAKKDTGSTIISIAELSGQLKQDRVTCELFCITYKISPEQVAAAIDSFANYLIMVGEEYTRSRFRSHFTNWLPKNLDKAKVPSKPLPKNERIDTKYLFGEPA